MKALQSRLENAEQKLDAMGRENATGDQGDLEATVRDQAGKIATLEAQVERLTDENARLREKKTTGSSELLSNAELLSKLDEASKPMREKIKPLYQIERAVLKELTIPETPYSCVVHLDLVNLATQAREEVEVPATANLKGEWHFPPVDQIATRVRPRGSGMATATDRTSAASPGAPSSATAAAASGRVSFPSGADPSPPTRERASQSDRTPSSADRRPSGDRSRPPAGGVPPSVPVVGELAGETVLNW